MTRNFNITVSVFVALGIFMVPALVQAQGMPGTWQDFSHTTDAGEQWLRVGVDGVGNQNNNVAWDSQYDGPYDSVQLNFDIRISEGNPLANDKADGFGFKWMNTADHGTSGAFYTAGEEPNLSNSIGLGFDIWDNGAPTNDIGASGTSANTSLSLHHGAWLKTVNLQDPAGEPTIDAPFSLETGQPINVQAVINPGVAGADGSVTVVLVDHLGNAAVPIAGEPVPGLTAYTGRPSFDARTGGAFADQDTRNFVATYTVGGETVVNEFPIDGAWSQTHNQSWTPQVVGDVIINLDGGSPFASRGTASLVQDGANAFLRLAPEAGSAIGTAVFEDSVSAGPEGILATFNFRGLNGDNTRADGMSFLLAPTDTYPNATDVPLNYGAPGGVEEANLAGAFGVGFDTFNNDNAAFDDPEGMANVGNHVSIHFDNSKVAQTNFALEDIDLVTDDPAVWHTATVLVDGDNARVVLTDGVDGSTHVAFEGTIAGLSGIGEVRGVFGARTGGAFDNYDVDNVHIEGVPEPSTLGLIGLAAGALLMGWRRRRSA